jgi:hypothetical protein
MEENPEMIADIAERTGTTEAEARVLYHLERTGEVFDALPNVTTGERVQFAVHHQALVNMMAARVAARDHPEAWGRGERPKGAGGPEDSERDT